MPSAIELVMEDRLFILLRIGLDISVPSQENISAFKDLTNPQWTELMSIAQEQGVLGLAFDGVERLDTLVNIDKQPTWLFEAYNGMLLRESLNARQQKNIEELCALWGKHGIKMLLLKGQSNGLYYPKPLHRDCGDIDCYLYENYDKGNDIIKALGIAVDEDWEKHSKFTYKGETIENHQFFVQTLDAKWWNALHSDLASLITNDNLKFPNSNVIIPPVQFNALFLTYHAMEHFTMGNLRLKQICDWAMFVKRHRDEIDWDLLRKQCERYRMDKFLAIMNGFISKFLCINIGISENKLQSDTLLNRVKKTVFMDKDFVWGDENENKWTRRLHYLLYNVKNSWKLRIAGRSFTKQMWLYVVTYGERK